MIVIAPTITEHYEEMGELRGEIKSLTKLFEKGILSEAQYHEEVEPLKQHLAILKSVESEELYEDYEGGADSA